MTVSEFLDGLICDMKDTVSDYKDDIRRTDSRLEKQDRTVRICELQKWIEILKLTKEELE